MLRRSTFGRSRPWRVSPGRGEFGLTIRQKRVKRGHHVGNLGPCRIGREPTQISSEPGAEQKDIIGICRTECIVGLGARIFKGFERLNLDEIRPGDFVVATLAEHSGWLETENIEVITFRNDSVMGVGEG